MRKKIQVYHGYIHWELAAMPRGFLVNTKHASSFVYSVCGKENEQPRTVSIWIISVAPATDRKSYKKKKESWSMVPGCCS